LEKIRSLYSQDSDSIRQIIQESGPLFTVGYEIISKRCGGESDCTCFWW